MSPEVELDALGFLGQTIPQDYTIANIFEIDAHPIKKN